MYGILFSISMVDFDGKFVGKYTNHMDPMESRSAANNKCDKKQITFIMKIMPY